jgi:hypothetical protein
MAAAQPLPPPASKAAMYDALDALLIDGDGQRAMSVVAALSAQVRGVAQLCNHLIDLYAYRYLTRNPFVTEGLADKLSVIHGISRVRIATNSEYHCLIKHVIALLSSAEPFAGKFLSPHDQYTYASILPYVKQYDSAAVAAPPLHPAVSSAVTKDTGSLLQVLVCAMRHGNAAAVQTLLEYLILSHELAPVQPVIHDSITGVREALRADIVFALWALIIEHSPAALRDWVEHHCTLYVCAYRRLHRESRLPLLLWCFGTLTKRRRLHHETLKLPFLTYPVTAAVVKPITVTKKAARAPLAADTARKLDFLAASVPQV